MNRVVLSVVLALLVATGGFAGYQWGSRETSDESRRLSISVGPWRAVPKTPTSLRIRKLTGNVVTLGSWSGYPLIGVRLRAIVCVRGTRAAIYPDEFRVTHFSVIRNRRVWRWRRTTIDRPMWLVPLGETWGGKPCGPVTVEDAISPNHYGAESLGNELGCYGVALSIKAGGSRDSRRAIIQCGGL